MEQEGPTSAKGADVPASGDPLAAGQLLAPEELVVAPQGPTVLVGVSSAGIRAVIESSVNHVS